MRPLFLISNDDGYQAPGINFLIEVLRPHANLVVVAPTGPRSGYSCAITSHDPIRCEEICRERARRKSKNCAGMGSLEVYACTGTPVDCVKFAFNVILKDRQPDLIIGGINHGDNSSVNTHYSGTMGVAMEGALQGYPAIAFSLCDHRWDADFEPYRQFIVDITFKAISMGMPPLTALNVNFPKVSKLKGVKVCRMAHSRWINELCTRHHPRGTEKYYWLVGENIELEPEATDTDRWALANGYAAITPTNFDVTAYNLISVVQNMF